MKTINKSRDSRTLTTLVGRFAAGVAVLALVILTSASSLEKAQAIEARPVNTQTAEIVQLLAAFHDVGSYNGDPGRRAQNLAGLAQLWAGDATLVLNNSVTFTGKPAILSFFGNGAVFNNNWISLSPTFRTRIAIHGNTAEMYLECIFVNEAKTVVVERALSGTLKKVKGNWLFWRMHNDPAMPLF